MDAEPADKTPLVNRPLQTTLIPGRTPPTAPLISPTISLPDDQNRSSAELDKKEQTATEFLEENTPNSGALALSLRLLNNWLAIPESSKPAPSIECGDRRILWALARIASRFECADKKAKPLTNWSDAVAGVECRLIQHFSSCPETQHFVTSKARDLQTPGL